MIILNETRKENYRDEINKKELIMHKTRFGKSVYMVGSNRNAAELCGINVSVVVVATFVI